MFSIFYSHIKSQKGNHQNAVDPQVALPKEVLPSTEIKDRKMPLFFKVDRDIDDALENAEDFDVMSTFEVG
jgi:hypothetical protein